jgi:5S rRNA maturation endonuclease (ribonuclease M5)
MKNYLLKIGLEVVVEGKNKTEAIKKISRSYVFIYSKNNDIRFNKLKIKSVKKLPF